MATIYTQPSKNKGWVCRFRGPKKPRQAMMLGCISKELASLCKMKIEDRLQEIEWGMGPSIDMRQWLAKTPIMRRKFAAAGLIDHDAERTLSDYCDEYTHSRRYIKPGTQKYLAHVSQNLTAFFGRERYLESITRRDADQYFDWLMRVKRYHINTAIHRFKTAKAIFRAAIRDRLIDENPFDDVVFPVVPATSKRFYVTREMTQEIFNVCRSTQWKLVIALARYGGLRTPSESHCLRWENIDWENNRMIVHSPKTEHHAGKHQRTIPLFAELRPFLEAAYSENKSSAYVVRVGHKNSKAYGHNAGTPANVLTKLIKRAGLRPWKLLWNNLRSSCETDLAEQYPMHVVTAWMGHSLRIAERHYLQVKGDHFDAAAGRMPNGTPANS